jgi:hypothetical protein
MKYHRYAACLFALLGSLSAATTPTDEGVPLNIDVRSTIDPKWEGFRKFKQVPHGKVYLLASVKEVVAEQAMVKPLDEFALVALLRQELKQQGFRESAEPEKAEVVLTVTYGRGFVRNPFADDMLDTISSDPPMVTITSAKQAMRQREPGYEGKMQKAQFEKLYIAVTAWKFPSRKGEKPNQLWRTVMVTDNPDGRDLNLAMPAMLAAGAGWFDKEIKGGEVTVNSTMPVGNVRLAPFEVIETGK